VLNILLSTSKLMVSLLLIFQILVCKIQGIENKSRFIYINKDLFLWVVPQSFCISNFSNMIIYSKVVFVRPGYMGCTRGILFLV
jgi:hypothetical protein